LKFEENSEMTLWPTFYGAYKTYRNRTHSWYNIFYRKKMPTITWHILYTWNFIKSNWQIEKSVVN
jgi:hypothetical protein